MRSGRVIRAGALLLLATGLLLVFGYIRPWLRNALVERKLNWNAETSTSSGDTLESSLDKEADGDWIRSEIVTAGVQKQLRHVDSRSVHGKGRSNGVSDIVKGAPLPARTVDATYAAHIVHITRTLTVTDKADGERRKSSAALSIDRSASKHEKKSSQKEMPQPLHVNKQPSTRETKKHKPGKPRTQKLQSGKDKQQIAESPKSERRPANQAPRSAVRKRGQKAKHSVGGGGGQDSDDAVDRDGVRQPFADVRDRPTSAPNVAAGSWANRGRQQRGVSAAVAQSVGQFMLFVGYPRSCHSLIASQLDAHPRMVVAHEYDLLSHWSGLDAAQRTRDYVFNTLFNATYMQASTGLRAAAPGSAYAKSRGAYSYGVPRQWQGNFRQRIDIIGDKHGGRTAKLVNGVRRKRLGVDVFAEIERALAVRLVFVHVMRHPMDNIATMVLRNRRVRRVVNGTVQQPRDVLDNRERLLGMSRVYVQLADAVARVRRRYRTVDVRCEDMVADPVAALRRLCADLGVACSPDYLHNCASIVQPVRSRTRDFVKWPPEIVEQLAQDISKYDFLARNYKMTL